MEPVRSLYAISTWLLRIAMLVMVYILYFSTLRSPEIHNLPFWIAAGFALFSMLLFVGGFMKKNAMTVISGLILTLGCVYKAVMHFFFSQQGGIALFVVVAAIGLFFFANGNKNK